MTKTELFIRLAQPNEKGVLVDGLWCMNLQVFIKTCN